MSETEAEHVPGPIVPHTVARSTFAERRPIVLTREQLFDEIQQPGGVYAAGSVAG